MRKEQRKQTNPPCVCCSPLLLLLSVLKMFLCAQLVQKGMLGIWINNTAQAAPVFRLQSNYLPKKKSPAPKIPPPCHFILNLDKILFELTISVKIYSPCCLPKATCPDVHAWSELFHFSLATWFELIMLL